MNRTVIALVGSMAAGKGIVCGHLKSLGFVQGTLSDRIREELISRGLDINRKNLQDCGNELREVYGAQVLIERTMEVLTETKGNIVIDGVRNPGEIEFLKEFFDASIIAIDAPFELRLEWYLARVKTRGEEVPSIEEFTKNNNRDFGIGEPNNGQQVGLCLQMADRVFMNDRSQKELFESVELFLKQELHLTPEGQLGSQEKK